MSEAISGAVSPHVAPLMRATGPAARRHTHLRQINPTGRISLNLSGKSVLSARPSHPTRGALRTSRYARWDAVDAAQAIRRAPEIADGEGVWSRSPDAGIKLRERCARRRWQEARLTEESAL